MTRPDATGAYRQPTWGCLACQGHKVVHAANCPNSTERVPVGEDATPSVRPEQVRRGADALALWVNPTRRIGWAEQAARVVLDAALAPTAKAEEATDA
jgi:hypothetical protein